MQYLIPKLKPIDIVVVVGSGPSLTHEQAQQVTRSGAHIFAVNNAWEMFQDIDLLFAADPGWWRLHYHNVDRRYSKGMLAPEYASIENGGAEFDVPNVPSQAGNGWPALGGPISRGSNSGFMATQIALATGAGRIVLLGMDCRASEAGKNHFFGDHPPVLPVAQHYDLWLEDWRALSVAPRPDRKPVQQLWDATPGGTLSVLTAIPYVSLEAALFCDSEEERRVQRQIELCRK